MLCAGKPSCDRLRSDASASPIGTPDSISRQLLIGRDAVRRMFLPHPIRVIGARAYQPVEPFRLIDWRAMAKVSARMVRILEPSSTPVLDIVLDFAGPLRDEPDYAPDELELAISVIAMRQGGDGRPDYGTCSPTENDACVTHPWYIGCWRHLRQRK